MMRAVIGMTIFLLLFCSAIAEAEYQAVAEDIAQQGRNKVRFKEETVAFYLDEPLLSEGTMKFDPPDKLTKIIEQPEYIKQQISGDEVLVTRGNKKTERFSLASHYGLEIMANTLRSLLSGKFAYLESEYSIKFTQQGSAWQLRLVPLEEKVEEIIESVLVEGEGGIITQYTITESNGDYTATSLYDENHR